MSVHNKLQASAAVLPPHLADVTETLPPHLRALVDALPKRLVDVAANAAIYSDRRSGADLLTRHVFPVSYRSLEVWPVPWQHVNGKAIAITLALLAVGYAKLIAAPVIMGGKHQAVEQHAFSLRHSTWRAPVTEISDEDAKNQCVTVRAADPENPQ
jgi:hypothetical protein